MNFEKMNFMVVPVEDPALKYPRYNGTPIAWVNDRSSWCSWEEREDVYPNCSDWYLIPSHLVSYQEDGIEMGYWVLDIDNHDGDDFKGAIEFLRSCHIPPTLTIRTPSGGLHLYYKAITSDVPESTGKKNPLNLPIEIKSHSGVLCPNGRDRLIIKDLPIAYLTVTEDSPLAELMKLGTKGDFPPPLPEDPDFDLSAYPYPDATPGERHDLLRTNITSMLSKGCPKSLALEWGVGFYNHVGRKPQPREIENVVEYAYRYLSDSTKAVEREIIQMKKEAEDPLAGATPLPPLEALYATALFSTPEEIYQQVNTTLATLTLTDEESTFVSELYTSDLPTMQAAWSRYPHLQAKFVYLKDALKLAIDPSM